MKLSFLGDISFNDAYKELYAKGVKPFEAVRPVLSAADYVIGNLECLPESEQGENLLRRPRIKTDLDALEYLNQIGVNVVSLANNHVYDNLEEGFDKTISFLQQHQIQYLGAGKSKADAEKPLIIEKESQKVGILAYVTEDTNPNLPESCPVHLNIFELDKALRDIASLKALVSQVIVIMHWGGRFENGYYPDFDQPLIARKLVEAGAELIVGHHSHTLQPHEKINGKEVFYSLGNFCFADVFFEGKRKPILLYPRFRRGAILETTLKNNSVSHKLVGILNQNLEIHLSNTTLSLAIRNFLFKLIKHKPFWNFYALYFKKIRPYTFMIRNYKSISFLRRYFSDK